MVHAQRSRRSQHTAQPHIYVTTDSDNRPVSILACLQYIDTGMPISILACLYRYWHAYIDIGIPISRFRAYYFCKSPWFSRGLTDSTECCIFDLTSIILIIRITPLKSRLCSSMMRSFEASAVCCLASVVAIRRF